MKKLTFTLAGALAFSVLSAQVVYTEVQFNPSSVTNEGLVVGTTGQMSPFYLWNPQTQEMQEIGGISAGNGIGGNPRFSHDGKLIAATMDCDAIPVSTEWISQVVAGKENMHATSYARFGSSDCYAIGTNGTNNMLLLTTNSGKTWKDRTSNLTSIAQIPEGVNLTAIASINGMQGLLGGNKGFLMAGSSNGNVWKPIDIQELGVTDKIEVYRAMDFIDLAHDYTTCVGILGGELADGSLSLWQTGDAGDSWHATTGVLGVPMHVSHNKDNHFFIVTKNGYIQTTDDYGLTWKEVFRAESKEFVKVAFSVGNTGLAVAKDAIYRTENAGKSWVEVTMPVTTTWNDAAWVDENTVMIVGNNGMAYQSHDKGVTWQKVVLQIEGGEGPGQHYPVSLNLYSIVTSATSVSIGADNGTMFYREMADKMTAVTAAIYNIEQSAWSPLEGSGYKTDIATSAAYNFSGDGKTPVGNIYTLYEGTKQVQSHAAVWAEGSLVDLGSIYADENRASRANAVSYDGSVVVGNQDHHGPWYAAIWRKNMDGSYKPGELILKNKENTMADVDLSDSKKVETDKTIMVGMAWSVSADGKWIGGAANQQLSVKNPWIWSKETGIIELETGGIGGCVSDMNNDASVVVGWYSSGEAGGWIWTEKTGVKNINDYLTDLGHKVPYYICSIFDMSPNGRYLTGWAMGTCPLGYVVDLQNPDNVENVAMEQGKATVYPNPAHGELHVDLTYNDVNTQVRLIDLQGRVVLSKNTTVTQNTFSLDGIAPGLYIVDVLAEKNHKSFKVEVK